MTFPSHFFKPAPSPSRSLRLLQLVALLALVGLVSTVVADPSVTSATCANSAGWCADGATVVFTGAQLTKAVKIGFTATDNAAITCTGGTLSTDATSYTCLLTVASESKHRGEYPVYVSDTYVGNLLVGTFYQQETLASNPFNKNGLEDHYFVASYSSSTPTSGADWTLYGNFSKYATYSIIFFNNEKTSAQVRLALPTCESVYVSSDEHNALVCKNLQSTSMSMGRYNVLVQDASTRRYLPGSALPNSLVVYPSAPTDVTATGDCALDSSKCVTSAVLTLSGTNFNVRTPSSGSFYTGISIGFPQESSGITCAVTSVAGDAANGTINCQLTASSAALPGVYPIYLQNVVAQDGTKAPDQHIGNFQYGTYYEWNPPGFNTAALPLNLDYRVTGIANATFTQAQTLTIFGFFPDSGKFDVVIYNTESEMVAGSPAVPSCLNPTLTRVNTDTGVAARPNAIICTLKSRPDRMGLYGFMVRDSNTGWLFPGSTTMKPFTIGRSPVVESITGDCATDSSKCVTGATLTFNGNQINSRVPIPHSPFATFVYVRIGVEAETDDSKAIRCEVTHTSGTYSDTTATCKLSVGALVVPGMYPIYMRNQLSYSGVMGPEAHVGNLVYGTFPGWNPPGYSNATLPDDLNYQVTSVDAYTYDHADYPLIYGIFPHDTEFEVFTYNLDTGLGSDLPAPACLNAELVSAGKDTTLSTRKNAIKCWLKLKPETMGRFRFIVRDKHTGWVFPGSTALDTFLVGRKPNVKNITGDCALDSSKCVTGAILTFNGNHINTRKPSSKSGYDAYVKATVGFNDATDPAKMIQCHMTFSTGEWRSGQCACRLEIGALVVPGMYPIYMSNIQTSDGVLTEPKYVGSILYGTFPGWNPPGYSNATLPDDLNYQVTSVDAYTYDHADYPLIYGIFPHDTEFEVFTYNLDTGLGSDLPAPACLNAELVSAGKDTTLSTRKNAIKCWLKLKPETMGEFRFIVRDKHTGWVFPGSTALNSFLVGRKPNVDSASGDCATDSSKCVTGAILTLHGNHINTRDPPFKSPYAAFVHMTVGFDHVKDEAKKIRCDMTHTNGAWQTGECSCKLTVGSQVVPGMYPIYMSNQMTSYGTMTEPKYVGSLLIGSFAGWKPAGFVLDTKTHMYNVTAIAPQHAPEGSTVTLFGSFNRAARYNVVFRHQDGQSDKTPTCKVTATTDNSVRCTIHYNGANVRAEFYPMVLDVATDTYLATTFSDEHSLTLDGDATKAANGGGARPPVATLITTIVFAALFVIMVVLMIVACCCCEWRRKTKKRYVYDQEHHMWTNEAGNQSMTDQVWEGCPMADLKLKDGTKYQNSSDRASPNNSATSPPGPTVLNTKGTIEHYSTTDNQQDVAFRKS